MFPLSLLVVRSDKEKTYVFIEELMVKKKPGLSLIKGRPVKRMTDTGQKENGKIEL